MTGQAGERPGEEGVAGFGFVARSLQELATMCAHDGSPIPRWLREGVAVEQDGSWAEWWEMQRQRAREEPGFQPNRIVAGRARGWAAERGIDLGPL